MSRPLRLEFPGAWWHVTNRGVEQRDIYLDDSDRRTFLNLIAEAVPQFRWRLHTYVLMNNHFHLFVETIEPTLSDGMKKIEGDYAAAFNQRHERVGHLFQGRFKSHLVDSETYLLHVARYIALNPVRANFTRTAAGWPWSSYRAVAGFVPAPSWLTTTSILDRFDPLDRDHARSEYRQFVGDLVAGAERPWDHLAGGLCLGSAEFVARIQERIDERERSTEHPEEQRFVRTATVDDVRHALIDVGGEGPAKSASQAARIAFAELARSEARAPLRDIGAALGIGSTGVCYLIAQAKKRRSADRGFRDFVDRVRLTIRNCRLKT